MTFVASETIEQLIEERDWAAVQKTLEHLPEPEIADLLFDLSPTQRMLLFRLLPRDTASYVFSMLEVEQQNKLLEDLTQEETRQLLESLSPDDRTLLFEELPGRVTQKLLNLLSPEDLEEARILLGYPEESVGRLMTPDYIAVRLHWTIQQALEHIRANAQRSETINVIYVTDADWKLLDALDLSRFILVDPAMRVEDIVDYTFISLTAFEDREQAVRVMSRYDLNVLPVVDSGGVLVGIVTFDDVLDVAEVEATEDFHKAAAVAPLPSSYRDASLWVLYRRRISWLLVLVFMNIFSGAALAGFEDTIASAVALVFFLPLLIGSSGNAGAQSATLMIRAMATGDVKLNDWAALLLKEIGVGLALGLTLGAAVFSIGVLRAGVEVAVVVTLAMVTVVLLGSIIGTLLPFLLSRLKLDPATASAPLITTLADISGIVIYFSLATWLLSGAEV